MKKSQIFFLTASEVVDIHRAACALTGQAPSVKDQALLESAVAAPSTELFGALMHPTVATMAGVLAFSLAKNHAFHDGNKRAAAAATETFLQGCGLSLGSRHDWATEFEKLAASETTRDEFIALIIDAIGGDVDVENE